LHLLLHHAILQERAAGQRVGKGVLKAPGARSKPRGKLTFAAAGADEDGAGDWHTRGGRKSAGSGRKAPAGAKKSPARRRRAAKEEDSEEDQVSEESQEEAAEEEEEEPQRPAAAAPKARGRARPAPAAKASPRVARPAPTEDDQEEE
jgi:hypothetical protein